MLISAPGKIFISGEWAILKKGNPGIVSAINKRAFANIKESRDNNIHIKIQNFGIKNIEAEFKRGKLIFKKRLNKKQHKELSFVKNAIEITLRYLKSWKPFRLVPDTKELYVKINKRKEEIGLGSSAAVVVATIAAILKIHNMSITKRENKYKIYKLAAIAHYLSQGKVGSGFDIAASVFGGIFIYKRFDPSWLRKQLQRNREIREVVNAKWPGFYYRKLTIPRGLHLIVGWVGKSASTSTMVKKVYRWQAKNKKEAKKIFDHLAAIVRKIVQAWREKDKERIMRLMKKNEELLRLLTEESKVDIETKKLREMSDIANQNGGAGKLSGAGGGDCGIAIAFDKKISNKIKKGWQENKILIIETTISFLGVKVENQR